MSLAQEANRYLDRQAPWKTIKENRQAAAMAIYTGISILSTLKTVLYPFLPFSSQKLHTFLGFDSVIEDNGWKLELPSPGQQLPAPKPLFTKFDTSIVAEETARIGQISNM